MLSSLNVLSSRSPFYSFCTGLVVGGAAGYSMAKHLTSTWSNELAKSSVIAVSTAAGACLGAILFSHIAAQNRKCDVLIQKNEKQDLLIAEFEKETKMAVTFLSISTGESI